MIQDLSNPVGFNQHGGPDSWGKSAAEKLKWAMQNHRSTQAMGRFSLAEKATAQVEDVAAALRSAGFAQRELANQDGTESRYFNHPNAAEAQVDLEQPTPEDPYFLVTAKLFNGPVSSYRAKLLAYTGVINLPDIADVKGGNAALKPKPRSSTGKLQAIARKRTKFTFKGVQLSRKPTKFEAKVLSLAEIPKRLDAALATIRDDAYKLRATVQSVAEYGASEVLGELSRQGGDLADLRVPVNSAGLLAHLLDGRRGEISWIRSSIERKLSERGLAEARVAKWTEELLERRMPALERRFTARAINASFAFGRNTAINLFRRRPMELGAYYGNIHNTVDAVVQTAVMDTDTCEECADVDGEVMDYGDDRQEELYPPYAKCYGGDNCRCVQIALLADGDEVDIDEVEEDDTID